MNNEHLKFPTGEFTHTELAKFNGKTNQQVWTRYQQAIKDGVIVSAGNRASAGKGKPSKLWKVNPNPTVPVAVSPTPAAPSAVPVTTPAATPTSAEVVPTEPIVVPAAAPAVPTTPPPAPAVKVQPTQLQDVAPATPPAPAEPVTATVEVLKIEAPAAPTTGTRRALFNVEGGESNPATKDARVLTDTCPFCNHPLSAIDDATGTMVWCTQPLEICPSRENPFGHGKNEKDAVESLHDKWDKLVPAKK